MSVFDGGLSSREIERKTHTDIAYMYLAAMVPKSECNGKWKRTGHKKSTKND